MNGHGLGRAKQEVRMVPDGYDEIGRLGRMGVIDSIVVRPLLYVQTWILAVSEKLWIDTSWYWVVLVSSGSS
jgi:hypothetical protein